MAKHKRSTGTISNRRARFDYNLGDSLVLGMQLTGGETKSLRRGHGDLKGAYITTKDNELWLINASITGDSSINIPENEKTRPRKLLAKRKEIEDLVAAKKQGMTIVPLEILTRGRYIKLRASSARGKKLYDKRQTIKQSETRRAMDKAINRH